MLTVWWLFLFHCIEQCSIGLNYTHLFFQLSYIAPICMIFVDLCSQIPSIHILRYTTEVLGVILALLDDSDESVQFTAVSCLLMVLTLTFRSVLYGWMELMFTYYYYYYFYFMPLICLVAQVLESSPHDAVEPILLNLSVRLRNLQVRSLTFSFLCTKILLIRFMAFQI